MNVLKTWLDAAPPAFDSPGELDTFLAEKAAQESMMLRRIAEPDAALIREIGQMLPNGLARSITRADLYTILDALSEALTHDR
jgi:hypothetical protein